MQTIFAKYLLICQDEISNMAAFQLSCTMAVFHVQCMTNLSFRVLRLEHACVRKHEEFEGVLTVASVTDVDHGKTVELIQSLKAILHQPSPAIKQTETMLRYMTLKL